MAIIKEFKAIRPSEDLAAEVSSPPYDVVTTEEVKTILADNPKSFLSITRSEAHFDNANSADPEVYKKAVEQLKAFISDKLIVQDPEPAVYLYQLTMGENSQTGIVACSAVDDYDNGIVRIHEKTRVDKEQDRVNHLLNLNAQTGPVFLAFRNTDKLSKIIEEEKQKEALYDFQAADGIYHKIWRVADYSRLTTAFEEVPETYVADGHHRASAASLCRKELLKQNKVTGKEDSVNFFLTVLFPDNELKILPYNRAIKKLPLTTDELLEKLGADFSISETDNPEPEGTRHFCMYLKGKWHLLKLKEEIAIDNNPVDKLDVSILQSRVLAPLLGIENPRTSNNITFVGGIRGTQELERLVNDGEAEVAFSLFPVTMAELFAVADNNMLMPPKSTWFEPKLRSGLFVHKFL